MTDTVGLRSDLLYQRLQEALRVFVGAEITIDTNYRVWAAIDYVLRDFEEFVVFDRTDYRARPRCDIDLRVELRKGR